MVLIMLVAERYEGLFERLPGEGRIDPEATHVEKVAVAVGLFEQAIDAERQLIVDRLSDIDRHTLAAEAAGADLHVATRYAVRLLGHAIDDAAAAAAPEYERARALEDLDRLNVVEIAIIFRVVAHAVGVEIRGRRLSANCDLVALPLALRHRHARHIGQRLIERQAVAIFELLLGEDRDRLGNVEDRRVGLGGGRGAAREIAVNVRRAAPDLLARRNESARAGASGAVAARLWRCGDERGRANRTRRTRGRAARRTLNAPNVDGRETRLRCRNIACRHGDDESESACLEAVIREGKSGHRWRPGDRIHRATTIALADSQAIIAVLFLQIDSATDQKCSRNDEHRYVFAKAMLLFST